EGNFITVRDALAQAPGEVIRLALLSTHYRDPLDWTAERLGQAKQTLDRWYRVLLEDTPSPQPASLPNEIVQALEDDLNAPLAITRLQALVGDFYRDHDPIVRGQRKVELRAA